jgi:nucleoid-associated protein YgaU
MDRKKKIGLAVTIVAVGAIIALQFKKDPQSVSAVQPTADPVQTAAAPSSTFSESNSPQATTPQTATAFDGRIEPAPGSNLAPQAPFAGNSNVGTTSSIGVRKPSDDDDAPARELVDLNAPDKTHRIIDGDTLQKLAQRYLGRADRYLELYAYNRDVLTDPDVLPIGVGIRIPSRVVIAPDANALAGVTPPPVLPLVPLAPASPTSPPAIANSPNPAPANSPAGAPAAAASAQKNGPRTYTVQEGDNLVDIARKLYGDGRKHEALFQANRRTMRTPADLKPGMILAVP